MKNQYIALLTISLLSCTAHAKVTVQDALNDAKYYANQVQGVSEADALADWKHNGKLPYKDGENEDWELRVWTSRTKGGCCGYVTRTWYGKFDKKTGKFLGYINQDIEMDSINGPHWK